MSEEMTNLPANPEEPDLEVVSDNTRYVHTFAEPFKWGGTEYEKLTFNFGAMKGKDVIAITQELRMRGIVLAIKTFDVDYQFRYAARCCEEKIPPDLLPNLPVRDFDAICNAAQRFLVSSGR